MSILLIVSIVVLITVILFLYIKITSRDIINVQDNFVHTKEFFKENPKLYEKYISDCSKESDMDDKLDSLKKEININIVKEIKDINEKINSMKEEILSSVNKIVKEEIILRETS